MGWRATESTKRKTTKNYNISNDIVIEQLNEVLTYALVSPKMSEEFVLLNNDESLFLLSIAI